MPERSGLTSLDAEVRDRDGLTDFARRWLERDWEPLHPAPASGSSAGHVRMPPLVSGSARPSAHPGVSPGADTNGAGNGVTSAPARDPARRSAEARRG